MHKYCLEFILSIKDASPDIIKNSLVEFGENLEILALSETAAFGLPEKSEQDFKIRISTENPTVIFDTCSELGRLKSVKIDEGK